MRPPKVSSFLCRLRFVDHKQNQKIIRDAPTCQRISLNPILFQPNIPDSIFRLFPGVIIYMALIFRHFFQLLFKK